MIETHESAGESIQPDGDARLVFKVRTGATISWTMQHPADGTLAAMQEMEFYCVAHPESPAAVRRPRLSIRGRTVVALLGPTIEEGIVGLG